MMKKDNGVFAFLGKVKDLELKTDEGKVNYRWGIVLIALIIVLTGSNWILKAIAFIVGTIKTAILKTNIIEEYEETNTMILIVLTIIFFVFCVVILMILDRNKEKMKDDLKKDTENNG